MFTNAEIADRATAIAAVEGGSWTKHIVRARREAEEDALNKAASLRKQLEARNSGADDTLRKDALAAQLRHAFGEDGPRRVVIGEVEIPQVGRLLVEHDQGANVIAIQDVRIKLGDVDKDLRDTFCAASADFSRAQDMAEQVTARNLVGFAVRAIIERHDDIASNVRHKALHVRYGV